MKSIDAEVQIEVSANLNNSESFEKVSTAIKNVLVGSNPVNQNESVVLKSNSIGDLSRIYDYIRSKQTISVARSRLLRNLDGNETFLLLNRQAAYAGAIVICDSDAESPLGAIRLTLRSPDILKIIDWLAPRLDKER